MKKIVTSMLALCLMAAVAHAQSPAMLADLHAFEQARYKAILANDLGSLSDMVAPELNYTHSNGTVENKAVYLEALRKGKYRFSKFETDSTSYRMIEKNSVAATGLARIAGVVDGKNFDITARFTAVYVRRKRHWLLHTWQTTRIR